MRLAILGAGGMLGHKMYSVLSREFPETYAIFRKPVRHYERLNVGFNPSNMIGDVDVRDEKSLGGVLATVQPDVIVNCVGLTTRKLGDQRESDIVLVNSVLPHRLKEWCSEHHGRLVHFSTDCVFSGKGGPYDPQSPKDAKDLYGQSKAIGEVEGPGVLTIRSSIIGLEIEGKTELLEWFLAQEGRKIKGFRNVMYSGVTTNTMASVVRALLLRGSTWGGVHQLASEPISKFALLDEARRAFGIDVHIEPVDEPISNKVLKQSLFFDQFGLRPPSWRDQLDEVAEERRTIEERTRQKKVGT